MGVTLEMDKISAMVAASGRGEKTWGMDGEANNEGEEWDVEGETGFGSDERRGAEGGASEGEEWGVEGEAGFATFEQRDMEGGANNGEENWGVEEIAMEEGRGERRIVESWREARLYWDD